MSQKAELWAVPEIFLLTSDNERQDIEEWVENKARQCFCSFSFWGNLE